MSLASRDHKLSELMTFGQAITFRLIKSQVTIAFEASLLDVNRDARWSRIHFHIPAIERESSMEVVREADAMASMPR